MQHDGAPRWDRWVLPPAVSAAVFAVLAVAPPLGPRPASVHRLESLGDPPSGRPWLLRALRTADSSRPTGLRVTSPDARVESLATLAGRGEWLRVLAGEGDSGGPQGVHRDHPRRFWWRCSRWPR